MKTLRQQFLEHVAPTSPSPLGIEIERADGVFLYSPAAPSAPAGKRYFDLISGVSVSGVGHGRPEVVDAVQKQASRYLHTMVYGETIQTPQVLYAARLAELLSSPPSPLSPPCGETPFPLPCGETPFPLPCGGSSSLRSSPQGRVAAPSPAAGPFPHGSVAASSPQGRVVSSSPQLQSVYFVNSGAEAVEGALKLAKRATGRREILSFRRAYHGSTHGALSLMSTPEGDEWRTPFLPLLPDVHNLTFNDPEEIAKITDRTACVVVEPVQGEAGVRPPAPDFLQALRRRCTETGALLVFDEIQTGMGRTGPLFAFRKYGVTPDILCLAKALGGGMPLGAFISSRATMSLLSHDPALGHITTFGGHPVCCAAGLAALEIILKECPPAATESKGALFESLLQNHPAVKEIRRSGLLLAVELGDSAKMHRTIERMLERGILSDWFLFCDTAFRISPPLTISEAEIRECCTIITECLDQLSPRP